MARILRTGLTLIAVLVLPVVVPAISTAARDFNLRPRVEKGFRINPVRLNMRGKNRTLVGLGSYIVTAEAACASCHTSPHFAPGGNPFLGEPERINTANFLAGGEAFGPFVSTNLTPDPQGRPGGLTYEQFEAVMRTGQTDRHPQFGPFLQVMSWPDYKEMSDLELKAIYEYLRAVPPAQPANK